MRKNSSRRGFIQGAVAAGAAAGAGPALAQNSGAQNSDAQSAGRARGFVRGFDHVALPMQNTDAMLAFYRGLGFDVAENATACSVYIGDQMINFHRPATWQRETFTLRAPAAKPLAATCASRGTERPRL